MSQPIPELKEKDFKTITKDGNVLVKFWAPWCHACKATEPMVEELAKTYREKVKFFQVNVVNNPGLASRLGVMSLPNILIFSKGKIKDQIIGASTKIAIEEKIKSIVK